MDHCKRCNGFDIGLLMNKSTDGLCGDCREMDNDEAVENNKRIRCPHCRRVIDPYDVEDYELLEEGVHEVWCEECENTFEISTYVQHTYSSPAMIVKS